VTSNVNSELGRVGSLLQFLLMEGDLIIGLFLHQISNMTLHDCVKIPQKITLMLAIGVAHNIILGSLSTFWNLAVIIPLYFLDNYKKYIAWFEFTNAHN